MAGALESFQKPFSPADDNKAWFEALKAVAPTLAEFIQGELSWTEGSSKRPPMTLRVFAVDGVLKAALGSQHWARTYYLVIKSPGELIESVEKGLVDGVGAWAPNRQNGSLKGR